MKVIKRIDVWSLAKMQGAVAFAIGLALGLIQWVLAVLLGPTFQGLFTEVGAGKVSFSMGTFAGVGFIGFVFFAALLAIMGFIGGAITAWVYNFIAPRSGGGIKIDLGEEE